MEKRRCVPRLHRVTVEQVRLVNVYKASTILQHWEEVTMQNKKPPVIIHTDDYCSVTVLLSLTCSIYMQYTVYYK